MSTIPSRSYADKDIKLLWGRAAARCAFPNCQAVCAIPATDNDPACTIGIIAHIVAHSNTGPRADVTFPISSRDRYENLILLCGTHHDLVDGQPNTYTAADLLEWKDQHERWVENTLTQTMPQVTFAELGVITNHLVSNPSIPTTDFTMITPKDKMDRNRLTSRITVRLMAGMGMSAEVQKYISHMAMLDESFPERLKQGFTDEYVRLRHDGLDGDALFEALHQFSYGSHHDFEYQAAGLAVLTYLFTTCEVFER